MKLSNKTIGIVLAGIGAALGFIGSIYSQKGQDEDLERYAEEYYNKRERPEAEEEEA